MGSVEKTNGNRGAILAKFLICSLIGIFMFFVPIRFGGFYVFERFVAEQNTIPLEHLVRVIRAAVGPFQRYVVLTIMVLGTLWTFVNGSWKKDTMAVIFTVFKVLGVVLATMFIWEWGPEIFFQPATSAAGGMLPFLFNALAMNLAFLIPIGALFLAFLTNYGLMEFIGTFLQPVMRKVLRTPGRSAVDAVASLLGSYSVSLLITDKLYQEGRYNKREAVIIGIGFATVSVPFMIVIATNLQLMDRWLFFFWTSLLVTFLVTAISSRIPPISTISTDYYEGATPKPEEVIKTKRFQTAYGDAMEAAARSGNVLVGIWESLKAGFRMTAITITTILSIGLLGLLITEYTPIFDWIGYIFFPFAWLVQVPEALLASQALATGIAEMFLPIPFVTEAPLATRYVVGVSAISAVVFFSAKIPCVLSTKIPVSVPKMVMIWVIRVILSILISGLIALIFLR